MLYFELGMNEEDYLTDKEIKFYGNFRRIIWNIKSGFGVIVKKKIDNKYVYVVPKINKKFLKKVDKILEITAEKQVCISNELFYKEEFIHLLKEKNVNVIDGKWIFRYMLKDILKYLNSNLKEDFSNKEIAFLVNCDYDLAVEYIKLCAEKFKIITIVSNNIKYFSKIENKFLQEEGLTLNIVNNYRKSLNKVDYVVNIDFSEKQLKKYNIYNKVKFINLCNEFNIQQKMFDGLNINSCQIAMPQKYIEYIELFKNFDYIKAYESLVKKKTSAKNIITEIEKDDIKIIFLENQNGLIKFKNS